MTVCLDEPCAVWPEASWTIVAGRVEELTRADRAGESFPLELVFTCLDEVRRAGGISAGPRSGELVRTLTELLARGIRAAGPASCTGRVLLRTLAVRILAVRVETVDDVIRSLRWLLLEWRSRNPQDAPLVNAVLRGGTGTGGSSGPVSGPDPVVVRNPWFGDRSSRGDAGPGVSGDRASVTAELLAVGRRLLGHGRSPAPEMIGNVGYGCELYSL
ncbi:MAG: hypothetical protein QG622_2957 [Actinomycetota bacterium]|nr:hypothetical protein [Actinomycetota bacterium]